MKPVDLAASRWAVEACGDVSYAPIAARSRAFDARVPGCVHSDLIRAGVIGHPDLGFNEEACQWIGRTDWRYRCVFTVDAATLAHEHVDLGLDGLDTIATIEVNGERVGEAMNMHHTHRFPIKPLLREGANELVITLRGPVEYVEEQERRLGARPVNGDWTPYSYIRKMASNFQWDWGPKIATCGIWRGAWLEAWNHARIAGVRPIITHATDRLAIVRVDIDVEGDDESVQLNAHCEHECEAIAVTLRRTSKGVWTGEIRIHNPRRWWPRGWGAQSLYLLSVDMARSGRTLDSRRLPIGLRTVELLQRDAAGEAGFAIAVNGIPIFCKGANWIPEGLFPDDQSPARIRNRVQQAADANMNMLRVWGGGTYEKAAFYDACDELGIMVWQDYMFACATYPEDEPYPALVEREAREAVTRLAHHPSIVLWCGGNENVLGYKSWGWKQRMPRHQKWGERYYFDILPRVVCELDPSRPYWPDSPHSDSARTSLHPNDPDHGDRHTWDAKVEQYRDMVPRFCSEFGHQSPPCWRTMRDLWGEDQLNVDSRAMIHRQRTTGGNDVWYGPNVMCGRWRQPRDFDEWIYQAHLLQARAMSIGIEWLRGNQPRCMGALFWQLNDAWAGHSWSCIDSAGRIKPAWYAARRSFGPRLLTIQPFEGVQHACAINESPHEWSPALHVRRMRFDGSVLAAHQAPIIVPPGGAWRSPPLDHLLGRPGDDRDECVIMDTDDPSVERAWWFHRQDRDLRLPAARLSATCARINADEVELMLHPETFIRDAIIAVDRVDAVDPRARISDNLLTLLPGESRALRIESTCDVPASAWITPPVFCCANEFSAGDRA